MKTKLSVVFAVFASIGLATALSATERPEWKFTEIQPVAGIVGAGSDAGGMSSTTGEELTGASLYFVARIERPDGSIDPTYGTNPRGVFVFQTSGGHYVVRSVALPVSEFAASRGN
jgi:hypothetical protein